MRKKSPFCQTTARISVTELRSAHDHPGPTRVPLVGRAGCTESLPTSRHPVAPGCSQKRFSRADNECRTSKTNMATRFRVSREACTDPSDVKNRRKSILTTLGLYMLRRPCCHADFLMSDTRCRRGKIVSDCNREPTEHLEVCSDSVHPTLSTRGTRIGPGQPLARKCPKVPDPRHYPPPQDVLSGTMFICSNSILR